MNKSMLKWLLACLNEGIMISVCVHKRNGHLFPDIDVDEMKEAQ